MKRFYPLVAVFLLSCSDSTHVVTDVELLTPRPFGYVIGDEIVHRVVFDTHAGATLNKSSVPAQGARNRWLNINEVQITDTESGANHHYQIELRYQVFYAPMTAKTLTIPSFTLSFAQGSQTVEQTVPAWQFTLSPLHELEVRKDESGYTLQPNSPPPLLSAAQSPMWLLFSGAAFFSGALALAYAYGYINLPRRKIFKHAQRQLALTSEHNLIQGLTILHQALNSLNGKVLFAHQLPEFYQKHPEYQAAESLLSDFFRDSSQYFFTGNTLNKADTWQTLKRCCQLCAEIERGLR